MLDSNLQNKIPLQKLVKMMLKVGLTPNIMTIIGLITGLIVIVFIVYDLKIWAFVFLCISGICDIIDGAMAREQGSSSPFGTLIDISFDRLVEVGIIAAIAFKRPVLMPYLFLMLCSIILCISIFLTAGILVSKKHDKSFYYMPGIMERTETFILLSALILFPYFGISISKLGTVLILITAVQRFFSALKYLKDQDSKNEI